MGVHTIYPRSRISLQPNNNLLQISEIRRNEFIIFLKRGSVVVVRTSQSELQFAFRSNSPTSVFFIFRENHSNNLSSFPEILSPSLIRSLDVRSQLNRITVYWKRKWKFFFFFFLIHHKTNCQFRFSTMCWFLSRIWSSFSLFFITIARILSGFWPFFSCLKFDFGVGFLVFLLIWN